MPARPPRSPRGCGPRRAGSSTPPPPSARAGPGASRRRPVARAAELAGATASLADELERTARVLQDQATDLADLVARERTLRERAAASGLDVRDGRVELAWGVSGTADATRRDEQEATRAALQADLDLVAAQHARRREFVLGLLRASTRDARRGRARAAARVRGSPHRRRGRGHGRATADA